MDIYPFDKPGLIPILYWFSVSQSLLHTFWMISYVTIMMACYPYFDVIYCFLCLNTFYIYLTRSMKPKTRILFIHIFASVNLIMSFLIIQKL